MPLSSKDNPKSIKTPTTTSASGQESGGNTYVESDSSEGKAAIQEVLDDGAGAPPGMEKAAKALPEKDDVQKGVKEAMLADTGQEEAQAKADVVAASPDAPDTPSGGALEATKGISDNVERGEEYAREKSARRWGYVTPDLQKDEEKK